MSGIELGLHAYGGSRHVKEHSGLLDSDQCIELVLAAKGVGLVPDWRTTQAAGRTGTRIPDTEAALVLRRRLAAFAGVPVDHVEPVEVVRYDVGSGYGRHQDGSHRSATLLVWLSEELTYAGGHVDFPEVGRQYRGAAGDAILFRNTASTVHEALPVQQGVKWVAVCFAQGRPVDVTKPSGAF